MIDGQVDVPAGIVDTLNDLSALRAELATEKANLVAELASARTDGQQSLRDRLDDASLEILVDQRKLLAALNIGQRLGQVPGPNERRSQNLQNGT